MSEGGGSEKKDQVRYEDVLATFKHLKELGVRDPEIDTSPATQEAMSLLSQYDKQELDRCESAENPEKAKLEWGLQRDMLFIDAGFAKNDPDRIDEVLDWKHQDFLRAEELGDSTLAASLKVKIIELLKMAGRGDETLTFFE